MKRVDDGITFGQWVRQYGLEPFDVTAEEIAYGVCQRFNWPASAELISYLIVVINEQELDDPQRQIQKL